MASKRTDILGTAARQAKTQEEILRSIDESLQEILDNGLDISQSSLGDLKGSYRSTLGRRNSADEKPGDKWKVDRSRTSRGTSTSKMFDEFTDEFEKQLMKGLFGSKVEDTLKKSISNAADELGTSIEGIPNKVGDLLAKKVEDKIKQSKFGQELVSEMEQFQNWGLDKAQDFMKKSVDWLKDGEMPSMSQVKEGFSNVIDFASRSKMSASTMAEVAEGAAAAGPEIAAMAEGATAAAAAFPIATAAIVAAAVVVEVLTSAIGEAISALSTYASAVSTAANSTKSMQKQMIKNQQDRMQKDVNAFIESSFKVLEEATQEMLRQWDESLEKVTATQGYTKSDVQDLLSAYASRLQSEGLSSVISTADILKSLENVLSSGLSGQVAEEFAYTATLLNKAIPTEDFFNYASTYASIAANQIAAGASQAQAIEYANQQLEQFASNLLYSSRELAGGFSTGLKDGSKLLEDAVKIANTARTGTAGEISGVLTSVSAIVGAIAPDLAGTLVDSIVSAATGGNSSNITALRSLSGVGASNTAFIQALASNPQQVFSNLFSNLADLQQMSNDNFMEVAEGLSEVFGISMDAFARVDFNYLANAISNMDTENAALSQNMKLLAEGQTTSSAEQLRIQEINQVMLEEGLAYVLDNEVARSIQENMWAQERANQMMEATYAVDLQGAGLELIQGLKHSVQTIANILNPVAWFKKVGNLIATNTQSKALTADLEALIEAGKVGSGNSKYKSMLLNQSGTALSSRANYLELLGGTSKYQKASAARDVWESISGQTGWGTRSSRISGLIDALSWATEQTRTSNVAASGVTSKYTWGNISKSLAKAAGSSYNQGSAYGALDLSGAQATMLSTSASRVQEFINTMDSFVSQGKSYEDWAATASKYGITNINDALQDFDLTEQRAREHFEDLETAAGSKYLMEKDQLEQQQLKDSIKWYEETWPEYQPQIYNYADDIIDLEEALIERADTQIKQLVAANNQLREFYNQWVDYYVEHTAYSQETLNAYDVAAIRNAEKSETGDAVLALAQALTSNLVDLKDPTVQTNVLLSQILIVAEAIMQQNNTTTEVSLPTALSALGLGTISTT